jgi:SanA protein
MQEGISAEEACRIRALTTEDFARMCNQDGSLKTTKQQSTTNTQQTMSPPSANNTLWYIAAVVFLVIFVLGIALLMKKVLGDKRTGKEKAHHPSVSKKLYLATALILCAPIVLVAINYFHIGTYAQYIERMPDLKVGIVPGGGIESNKPLPLLQDRLDAAASLLQSGRIDKLIVSGDNRFDHYNEPEVMKAYLVREKSIDPKRIYLDNAGRSTYETCERAKKIFNLNKAVLISERTHLPRAIFLCRSFGIEAYGFSSDGQSSAGRQVGQRFREILARTKAGLNVYVIGERTVLGEKIEL